LTPFAALLDDGNPHTITVNVFNNGNYFAANGALLVYLDHGSSQVTGGLVSDATSLYPSPVVSEDVATNSKGTADGSVSVTASHPVSIEGYVNTSQGRIDTKVQQQISFSNTQEIKVGNTVYDQNIKQSTTVVSTTTTTGGSAPQTVYEQKSWPLALTYDFVVNADGSAFQKTSVSQGKHERTQINGGRPSYLTDDVTSNDMLNFPASGGYYPSNADSSQTYTAGDGSGYCYAKTVSSSNYAITTNRGGFCGSAIPRAR
jgi:hypothetical protein